MEWFISAGQLNDLLMFLLGAYGVKIFPRVQTLIASCDKDVFAFICIVVFYFVLVL